MSLRINNLGTFDTLAALWAAHPEGGREGDYATIAGVIYDWNKYLRIWGDDPDVPDTPLRRNFVFEGDVEATHDVKVNGTLWAKHVKQPHMGMYASEEALLAALPTPERGWYALVGNTLPAELYVCNTAGTWTDSGNQYDGEDVDLTQYVKTTVFQDYTNRGYKIVGDATPSTSPSYPTKGDAYLASTPGVYASFGSTVLLDGQIALFKYDGSAWSASIHRVGKDYDTEISELNLLTTIELPVDFSRLALRNYSLGESGNYGTANTYKHCLIPIVEGNYYRIISNPSNPTRYAWFTDNSASVSGAAAPLVTGTTRMTIEAGAAAVVKAPSTAKYLYIYRGTSSAYAYTPSSVALMTDRAKLSYTAPENRNLMDPSKFVGGYIDNSGKAYESDDYYQTDYIAIDPSTDYTVLCKGWSSTYYYRYVCFYDSTKSRISGISTIGKTFTSPAGASFVIVSLYRKNNGTEIDPKNYGLFAGESPSFEPYYGKMVEVEQVPLEKKSSESVVTKRDLENTIADTVENLNGAPPLKVKFTNPGITITATGYSNVCSFDRHYLPQFAYSANHIFNFDDLTFGDASSSTMDDDVAPSHFQNTTLGANHAQPTQIATIAGHGKTNASIGTAWVKGSTTFYIVRIVDEDNIEFLSENKGTYNNHNFVALTTGTITNGSETMTITAISPSQLWPCVKNKSQKLVLDGKTEVTQAGTYKCHYCEVIESYDMMNTADVLANLIDRAGSDDDPVYTGASMLRFENIYRFFPGGQVLVMENVIALEQVPIQDIMFNQMALFGSKNYVKTYVPNSLPVAGYDFRTPLNVDWSSSVPAINFTTQEWKDPNNPPNRVLMIKSSTSASNGYGIALGFLPYGVGKDLKLYTNNVFELRNNTGKVYPHGVHSGVVGTTMQAGDAYNAVLYRVPFAPQPSHRIAYYTVPFGDSVYAFVDYAESKTEQLTIDEKWNGKPITVIEAVNASLLTDIYNHGFRVRANYVSGETCFLVVKIG